MYARYGDRTVYDNYEMGIAQFEEDPDFLYLAFTDSDNEHTHLFKMTREAMDAFADHCKEQLGKKTVAVYGPGDMPKEGPSNGTP